MIRRPPRSTLFPYPTPSDLETDSGRPGLRRQGQAAEKAGADADVREALGRGRTNPGHKLVQEELLLAVRSEEHTSELQSPDHLVCRLLLEKKKNRIKHNTYD